MSLTIDTRPIESPSYTEWSAVHLPILYEISNNYFPTNTADTTVTISSEANDNGFMQLNLSGSLGTFEALDYVSISGADIPDGNYQILSKGSSSQITINYPYESITNTGNVVLYRNNYHILIHVWCGLKSTHTHQALKPYELAATLKFVPDSNNDIKFSINEIVKGYIAIKNDLQLSTLPNNLDAWCQFYIETAESYDVSDGDVVTTFTSSFISDASNLEGYAANAKLPFKNSHSGWMTDYIATPRKFLTLFNEMYLYLNNYMDIGFIVKEDDPSMFFIIEKYIQGVNQGASSSTITTTNNAGIFRWPMTRIDNEDTQILVLTTGTGMVYLIAPLSWTDGADPFLSKSGTSFLAPNPPVAFTSYSAYQSAVIPLGQVPYPIQATINITNLGTDEVTILFQFVDSLLADVGSSSITISGSGTHLFPFVALTGIAARLYIFATVTPGGGPGITTLQIDVTPNSVLYAGTKISEEKTVNIVTDCANQELNICWLNYLGGFDWHVFTTRKTYSISTTGTRTQKKNIFADWPTSYGDTADTINRVTKRDSVNIIEVTSQYITDEQEDAIKYIMTSPLIQIVVSETDRRTVIVKNTTLPIRRDRDKLKKLSFTLEYTDEIPSQSL